MWPRHHKGSWFPDQHGLLVRLGGAAIEDGHRPGHRVRKHPAREHRPFWYFSLVVCCTLIGIAVACVTRPFRATVPLFAYERTFATQAEAADFVASATASASLATLSAQLPEAVSHDDLDARLRVNVDPGQSYIGVSASAADVASARTLAEAFATQVAASADEWVSRRTSEVDRQISAVQSRLRDLRSQFGGFDDALRLAEVPSLRQALAKEASDAVAAVASLQSELSSIDAEEKRILASFTSDRPALRSVQQELEEALTRYTEEHPRVRELRASLLALQKESLAQPPNKSLAAGTNVLLAELNIRRDFLRTRLANAEEAEVRSREALQRFVTNEVDLVRLQSEYAALGKRRDELIQSRVLVGSQAVEKWRRSDHVTVSRVADAARFGVCGAAGALLGLCVGSVGCSVVRRKNRIIRDAGALERVTGLPVLAALPDLAAMTGAARQYWAIETLHLLRNRARVQRRGCFVCGIISSRNGEGRSTWIDLFAEAGLQNGHRVLVVSRPSETGPAACSEESANTMFTPVVSNDASASANISRYALVGHVSNVSLQRHWEHAFSAWQNEDDALVLVELPPATTADALLLSSAVPNVLWLGAANIAEAQTTFTCVNSLRNAGCHLLGAALNWCASTKTGLAAGLIALTILAACGRVSAQETNAVPIQLTASTNALSALKTPVLAPWQQKLTLGPGDAFDISLYGQPDSLHQVVIGPDGRFSFLQAPDVVATGLTVDELRGQLETILMKFHLAPRVVIVPTAFHSKKYYVLGSVNGRGAYPLDVPTTIVEAVAKAKGFITAGQLRSTFNLADLSHAFLARRQADGSFARESVDFEGLFQRGELQNNKLLAPDDYIYFPPTGLEEVYVLGEVKGIGPLPYTPDLTVLGAIAGKGGFTDEAFRQRVLVVRGSLERPETFVVNSGETLRALTPDFVLKPRDIIYVSRKPWAKAEELLKAASSDFIRAAVTSWTGQNIQTLIK